MYIQLCMGVLVVVGWGYSSIVWWNWGWWNLYNFCSIYNLM